LIHCLLQRIQAHVDPAFLVCQQGNRVILRRKLLSMN